MLRLTIAIVLTIGLLGCGKPEKQLSECSVDTDCALGEVCQDVEGYCIEASCDFCTDDQVCYKPTPESEGTCSAPPDCEAGECDPDTTSADMGGETDASSGSACANLRAESIAFGPVEVDESITQSTAIENCSDDTTLTVDATGIGPFAAESLEIPPGEALPFEVTFSPTTPGMFSSELLLATNAGDFRVAVTGEGVDAASLCPIPVVEAGVDGELNPVSTQSHTVGTLVTLSAAMSQAQNGEIATYEWTVVDRPETSASMLSAPDADTTTLELDVIGDYSVDLNVIDSEGREACVVARATLTAVAEGTARFRIVLTWDTPADPDQTDANGTDMDLHYLNPMGEWNVAPGDIYWLNPTADWAGEDPLLDIDDTDGAGPEVILHNAPRTDVDYRIGTYYYEDRSFGPSYATLQVFVNGALTFEAVDVFMPNTGAFWGPLQLNGLDGAVADDNAVMQQGFPNAP